VTEKDYKKPCPQSHNPILPPSSSREKYTLTSYWFKEFDILALILCTMDNDAEKGGNRRPSTIREQRSILTENVLLENILEARYGGPHL
jgi:hypothetical protein